MNLLKLYVHNIENIFRYFRISTKYKPNYFREHIAEVRRLNFELFIYFTSYLSKPYRYKSVLIYTHTLYMSRLSRPNIVKD